MVRPWIVEEVIDLTKATYIIRFSKNKMQFKPGQHLVAGLINTKDSREYSIYSGLNDSFLEILVREVEEGVVSKKLRRLTKGDTLEINGPYGFFMYNIFNPGKKKVLFIASGTGIAPFRSFARSFPDADYQVIHGIRDNTEAYGKKDFRPGTYTSCTSRNSSGDFSGRVTDYLNVNEIENDRMIYLCGNSNMILESVEILESKGISDNQIFTEVYF